MNKIELIDELLQMAEDLEFNDKGKLDSIFRRGEMIIRNIFGNTSKYINDINSFRFFPNFYPYTDSYAQQLWSDSTQKMKNLFNTMKEEILLFEKTSNKKEESISTENQGDQIFIVHGHDEAMKESVARALTKLELTPIILHEQPNKGRTIIEKFTDYSNVSFAIVLLSPDDIAYGKNEKPDNHHSRARQNVIFELGYFIGKLGRDRVIALYRKEEKFEMPSDYSGVLFVEYDNSGRWQFDIIKELKASGYSVDANNLL